MAFCPHHLCGVDCRNDCTMFVCDLCSRTLPPNPEDVLLHAKMYEIGHRYDVLGLQELAKQKFQAACHIHWNHAIFAEAAQHVFYSTPKYDKGLRDVVCRTLSKHLSLLQKPEIAALIKTHGQAFNVLIRCS